MASQWQNQRGRVREVIPDLQIGRWLPGPLNSITDVAGVLVHTQSIHTDKDVNTGVTTILPRPDWDRTTSFAGIFSFNGCGEMTGTHWIQETGLLTSPIVLTNSASIGDAHRGIMDYAFQKHTNDEGEMDLFVFPIIAETYDGYLNNQGRFAVKPQHIVDGIQNASSDRVPEGNTGGGTGMICHRFKGGTGSSSRLVHGYDSEGNPKTYTVGVLVQANYGAAQTLHIGGVPVGRILAAENGTPIAIPPPADPAKEARKDGSIIIVIATDVPLMPIQLQRVAKRASVGLAKVGGYGNDSSGDIFLAFSTGNKIPVQDFSFESTKSPYHPHPRSVEMIDTDSINGIFEAAADATEEAIYNAMFMAESMTGFRGRTVDAIDLVKIKAMVESRL
ncbi:Beta-peptidyl aminopeptidase BapA [Paramyrothecium foliicola]|nr:Beta-peptidyl aminopeptidase BapA [Paramyrothecium foliicola]